MILPIYLVDQIPSNTTVECMKYILPLYNAIILTKKFDRKNDW